MPSVSTLARWLGPWASDDAWPEVRRRSVWVHDGDRALQAWLYTPRRRSPTGAYLISPGLHYGGPADPRLGRFCSVLAAAGLAVLAPFVPDYNALVVAPRAIEDFALFFDALLEQPEMPPRIRPGVFSISFGSLLALRLASSPERAERVGSLVVFGGYAEFDETVRFCASGEVDGRPHTAHDPLNLPVVFMNLIDRMDAAPPPEAHAELFRWWRVYVECTWGRVEMKTGGRHIEAAESIAAHVRPDLREFFLIGCAARPGGRELCFDALGQRADALAYLDPRPHMKGIRCPVHVFHGVEDDVIPYTQAQLIHDALPAEAAAGVHLTGLYGHSGSSLGDLRLLGRELVTMVRMLRALANGGAMPERRALSS